MKKLLYTASAFAVTLPAMAITSTPDGVVTGVGDKFDLGATTGLAILGFLLGLGAILKGIRIYRR